MQGFLRKIEQFLRLNKKLLRYLSFVGIALLLWFLTILSKEYETTTFIPISFQDLPQDQQLMNFPAKQLEVKIKTNGFYLIQNSLQDIPILQISINDLIEKNEKELIQKHFIVRENIDKIQAIISSKIEVIDIHPDTVTLHFKKRTSKWVPIHFDGDIQFSPTFRLKGKVRLIPDSVLVYGSKEQLGNLENISTEFALYQEVNSSFTDTILLMGNDGLSYEQPNVKVQIETEKFTEKIIEIPVMVKNMPKGFRMKIFPPKIEIVTRVAMSEYPKINSDQFVAEVDAKSLENKDKLDVKLSKHPLSAQVVLIKPKSVEFLLIRK